MIGASTASGGNMYTFFAINCQMIVINVVTPLEWHNPIVGHYARGS